MEAKVSSFSKSTMLRATVGVLLLLILWFGTLEYRDLFHPDEGRYAEIPREMIASGDWVTPRLNGLKYFEKPVLQYWVTAIAYQLFGEDEWTARLWPAVTGFLTVLLVYSAGRRLAGKTGGRTAALVLASTFQFFLFSQILTLDMGLTFFLTLVLVSFIYSQDVQLADTYRRNWMLATWGAIALAVLSKGLIGVALPALILLAYVLIERDWRLLGKLHWGPGVLLFLTIVLPWFLVMQQRNPEFFDFFIFHEHFARYTKTEHARSGQWYYFLAVLMVGALPWPFVYTKAAVTSWRAASSGDHGIRVERLLVLWVLVPIIFFSLSASKLPAYILPVYPALALLVARQRSETRLGSKVQLVFMGTLGFLVAAIAPYLGRIPKFAEHGEVLSAYVPWMIASGVCLIGGALMAGTSLRRGRNEYICALFSLVAFNLLITGSQSVVSQFTVEELVEKARRRIGEFQPGAPFYSVEMYDQTLPVHIGRTVTLVGYSDELSFGISQEPEKAIRAISDFRVQWTMAKSAYAIMPLTRFAEEQQQGTPLALLAKNSRTALVTRDVHELINGPINVPTAIDRF